jgi:hypothetical protein
MNQLFHRFEFLNRYFQRLENLDGFVVFMSVLVIQKNPS